MRRVTPALVGCLCLTLFASATALGARETRATVATATSAQLAASARGITPEARSAAKRHFVETQASSGRLVDASAVEVGSVDGVTFAWDAGITPPEITVRTVTDVPTGETASQQIEATTSDTDTPERAQPLGGAGMGSIVTTAGSAALLNAACLLGTAPNGKMTWCYERFKVTTEYDTTRDYYVSNRYSYTEGNTWTGFYDWRTSFNRIRTDPHPSYPGRVVGLGGFSPNSATQNCASSFGSLSVDRKSVV